VNPLLHKEVISNVHEIASKIMIVEPSPDGCPAYRKYSEIWANAMHSIGKFEDYQSPFYWKKLIEKCNFKITVLKRIKQNKRVSPDELEKIIQTTVETWKRLQVEDKYINEMCKLIEYVRKKGMKWSDLTLIIGKSTQSLI
jgi:hypothetical protein